MGQGLIKVSQRGVLVPRVAERPLDNRNFKGSSLEKLSQAAGSFPPIIKSNIYIYNIYYKYFNFYIIIILYYIYYTLYIIHYTLYNI